MPSKKQQINPFSMYMQEQEPLLRRRGLQFHSKKEVVDYLFPHFNNLSDFEKQKYKNMAKIAKEKAKADLTRKFDDRGVPLSQIAAEDEEARSKKDKMLSEVRNLVHSRSGGESLLNIKFYAMFVSLHCYTDHGKEAEYVPCEIAVSEWTLADGLLRSCSYIIEPDRIPVGYKSRCRDISESTHQVPLGHPGAESNFPGLWIRLRNFINPQEALDQYPPVFTASSALVETEGALRWLHERSADRRQNPFRVYPLERLLFELFQAAGEPQLETTCYDVVHQGQFDYFSDLACDFHQQIDNPKYCTLAMSRRQAFSVLDRVAGRFGVELMPGRHVPESKTTAGVEVFAPVATAATARPIAFKPARQNEPDMPTEYTLITATRSQFRGGDRETPVAPGAQHWTDSDWAPVYPADGPDWGAAGVRAPPALAAALPRRPTALGQAAAAVRQPLVSEEEFPALGQPSERDFPALDQRPRKFPAPAEPRFSAGVRPSEEEFPALGQPAAWGQRAPSAAGASLEGRSRPGTVQPRAPGAAAAGGGDAGSRAPVIGRGRSSNRTTVAGNLAARFASGPGQS